MEIKSTFTNKSGQILEAVYHDIEKENDLQNKKINAVHAYCFYKDKLVIVYAGNKGKWTPPGGHVENEETISSAVIREVKEETNMKVINQRLIGYHDIVGPQGIESQTRSVCIVEPYGPFISDPDGDITEIKFIHPKEYKYYFNWGEAGDHMMKRALNIKIRIEDCTNK